MKKRILLILTLILGIVLCGCSSEEEGYPKPTERFFVNDFADVISETDEDTIFSSAAALDEKTDAQVVVITVESLNGEEASDYALHIGREWGVGDEDKDNGIVILLSESDREIYIAVGYGLEGALPDSKTGRIIDNYGIEHFQNDDFSEGLTAIADAVINEIYIEYGLEPAEGYTEIDKLASDSEEESSYGLKVLFSWIIMIVVIVIFFSIFGRKGFFFFGGPRGGGHFGGGSMGGFSSGSFRGGSGGFSGGGGSFGGGGAGRRF